jgi:hypothetical protein
MPSDRDERGGGERIRRVAASAAMLEMPTNTRM